MGSEPENITRKGDKLFHANQEYNRDLIRSIMCEVTELAFASDFSQHIPGAAPTLSRHFTGKLHLSVDAICIVGTEFKSEHQLKFRLSCAIPREAPKSDGTEPEPPNLIYGRDMLAIIGFNPSNWEIGSDDTLWLQIDAPPAVFDNILTGYEANWLKSMSITLELGLWARSYNKYASFSQSVTWYLFPEEIFPGSTEYEQVRGRVTTLRMLRHPTIDPPPVIEPPPVLRSDDDELAEADDPEPFPAPLPIITDADRKSLASIRVSLKVIAFAVVLYAAVNLWRGSF